MALRSAGRPVTSAPTPSPQASMSITQPAGTAKQKRSVRRRPWLAAIAVDSVVLGPGEKLMAVQNASRAVSSAALIAGGPVACACAAL